MQIEEDEEISDNGCWCCLFFHRKKTSNPDFNLQKKSGWFIKKPYIETGYLLSPAEKEWRGNMTMESLRRNNSATKNLSSPEDSILKSNSRKIDEVDFSPSNLDMNVTDVNNLLRRRLSLRVLVNEDDKSCEKGEALLPRMSTFSEATPYLLSHLVTDSPRECRRKSSIKVDIEKFRSSFSNSKATEDLELFQKNSVEQKSDKEFLDYLLKTSHFMKEALEKDWTRTKNYVRWLEDHVKNAEFDGKVVDSTEKWLVVLYTSSEDSHDQLSSFRCMLVRLLLQNHCIVYEERDIMLPQYRPEFEDRLMGDKLNIPQVYMHGVNIGGYRVMYAIHKMGLAKSIFEKFIIPSEGYAEWMFNKESKTSQLSLEVNLKAFPALQALAGSWANNKLSRHHLEFVNMGKMIVKHARESWYRMSSQPYFSPDLRRYALLRLTIVHTLIAMNKVYKQYINKIDLAEGSLKSRRKLSWLPRLSKQMGKD